MAVLDHRVEPARWEDIDGSTAAPPEWLGARHEAVYECVRLLANYENSPSKKAIFWYGESVLNAACEQVRGASVCDWLRAEQWRVRQQGISLGDPDIFAMPVTGGPVRIIEVKGEGDGVLGRKDKLKQVNSLALLRVLGVPVELWYVLAEERPEGPLPEIDPRFEGLRFERQEIRARAGLDFSEIRRVARSTIPPSKRSKACECEVPCLSTPT
jgi:hypothetical protein